MLLRGLVRTINLKCLKMGSTCPRTSTVGAIGHSTKPWDSKRYYPDHVPMMLPSIFPGKEFSKQVEMPISTHEEISTRARSVRLVSEQIASAL